MTYQSLIPKVAQAFGLNVSETGLEQKGYRNESYRLILASGEQVNLIFHKSEQDALERIKSADYASDRLFTHYPIRTRYDEWTLKLSDGKNEVYAGLYTYLPGVTIPWEAYTKNHIKLLGWAMSDMHAAWSLLDSVSDVFITDELRDLTDRMEQYFASPNVHRALEEKLKLPLLVSFTAYTSLFTQFDKVLDPQEHVLHMDLVRGNVLFATEGESPWSIGGLSISGIIDFEKAATGHCVFDIARTLAFLLVDCAAKDRRSIFKYFLQSGYNKRGKSSFSQKDELIGMPAPVVLNKLISFFLLHDFYKFLIHTPYESLPLNHHFIRTHDILLQNNMVRYV